MAEIESDPGLLSKLNSTIKKYNQAIEYCKSGSRDLAMIQLKKVISQNPNLVKAHQLLGLLYIEEGKFADARKVLSAAAKIDSNNTTTIRYIHEVKSRLKESNKKQKKKNDVVSFSDGNDTVIMTETSLRSMLDNTRTSLINILLGLVVGLLICFFLVVPTVRSNMTDGNTKTVVSLNETLAEARSENDALNEEIEKLKTSLSAYDNKQDVSTSYDNLWAAQNYYTAGDNKSACEYIQLVTKDVLGEQGQIAYDTLYEALVPSMTEGYYEEGNTFYTEENYESAILNLKNVVDVDEKYNEGAALFLLGDCYRLTGDTETAMECFNKVIEYFPNNKWGRQAKVYLAADDTELTATEIGD